MRYLFILISLTIILSPQFSDAQTTSMVVCGDSNKNTIVTRPKRCRSNEKRLTLSNFQGSKGDTGQQGAAGARGESAFDPIPSGKTVLGVVGFDGDDVNRGDYRVFESFPGLLTHKLANSDVIVASNDISTTGCGLGSCLASFEASQASVCTGSHNNPTAPAGKVCVYMIFKLNIAQQSVSASPLNSPDETTTKGFNILFTADEPGDFYIAGVWAYTAP